MKKTSLYDKHVEAGGKIVDFSGWAMPIQYSGIIDEHTTTRDSAGLFDVSHMGEILVTGEGAKSYLQYLLTNNIEKVKNNKAVYTHMCYENGTTVDDLIVYKKSENNYLLVVNASNIEKDFEWIDNNKFFNVDVVNISDDISQIALQGPNAETIIKKLYGKDVENLNAFTWMYKENNIILSRTGYTGEDGFEIYSDNEESQLIWDRIMALKDQYNIAPVGLGARDTLRLEACLPLYGHELSQDITPVEAELSFFIDFKKKEFIGKEPLLKQKKAEKRRTIIGFEMIDRGIPRQGYEVCSGDETIGFVTSGGRMPCIGKNMGMAIVDNNYQELGKEIYIKVRNKTLKAKVVKKPFYKKQYKKK